MESGTATLESVYGRLDVGPGDYVVIPTSTTHRWVPALPTESRSGRWCSRPGATSAHPAGTCRRPGSSSSTPPTASGTCGRPTEPLLVEDGETPVLVRARDGPHPLHLPPPSLRRGRVGRVPVPLRLQHRRLRADRRAAPPAAARPPDLRGAQLRGLLLRAPPVRLPPRGGAGALQPRQRRLRRGAVLRGRRLHVPQGVGDRPRVDQPPPRRLHPRPPARQRGGGRSARPAPRRWR